jgi:hypothetical protein
MTEHNTSTIVGAPVHQVYTLFTQFGDFPKYMQCVREVIYLDGRHTHWVVRIGRRDFEWVAVNQDWVPDQQIGWRSVSGIKNDGCVRFHELGPNRTMVDAYLSYTPPSGPLGSLVDTLSISQAVSVLLRQELHHFAHMVEQTPAGELDPMRSHYLFHPGSAYARGMLTTSQKIAMRQDPRMRQQALAERRVRIERERSAAKRIQEEQAENRRKQRERELALLREQREVLAREAARRLREEQARLEALQQAMPPRPIDPVYDTIGGRNAALDRTAAGDRDGLRRRFPGYELDPMISRYPLKDRTTKKLEEEVKQASPWWVSIRGAPVAPPPAESGE